MRKIIYPISAIITAAVFLLSTAGISLNEHFCECSNEVSASIFVEIENCCAQEERSTVAGKMDCCESHSAVSSQQTREGSNTCCQIEDPLNTQHSTLNTQHSTLNTYTVSCNPDNDCCTDEVKFIKITEPYTFVKTNIELKTPIKDVEIDYHIILTEKQEESDPFVSLDRNGFFPPPKLITRLSILQQFKLAPPPSA